MSRITNNFAVGEYAVTVIAFKNTVARFSVVSLEDAEFEAQRTARTRQAEGKQTEKASARLITGRVLSKRGSSLELGTEIDLPLSSGK